MLKLVCLLAFCLSAAVGLSSQQRIIGGSLTTIDRYPFAAVVLGGINQNFRQHCGGTIINNRSVVSAAHCFDFTPDHYRIRVGSSFAHSGGTVHTISRISNHPDYNPFIYTNDISVVRISGSFSFGSNVQPGRIAGGNYNLGDNQVVWAAGWGTTTTSYPSPSSEQLRHVQIWTVNQSTCRERNGNGITDNMLCAGYLDVGGRSPCYGDSGGPLLHNGVLVGIVNFGICASPRYPGVFARVSRYTSWIQSNQ